MFTKEEAFKLREEVRKLLDKKKKRISGVAAGRVVGIIWSNTENPIVRRNLLRLVEACVKARDENGGELLSGWDEWDRFVISLDRQTIGLRS